MPKVITSVAIAAALAAVQHEISEHGSIDPRADTQQKREFVALLESMSGEPRPASMNQFLDAKEAFDVANHEFAVQGTRIIAAVIEAVGNGQEVPAVVEELVLAYVGTFEGLQPLKERVDALQAAGVAELAERRRELEAEDRDTALVPAPVLH